MAHEDNERAVIFNVAGWRVLHQHGLGETVVGSLIGTQSRTASRSVSIPMVRAQLRGADDHLYAPYYVPIGPYHLDRSCPGIEKEKNCSVGLLQSLSEQCTEPALAGLIANLESHARECYADGVGDMTPEQFRHMLLRDGCYLLILFLEYVYRGDMAPPGVHERSTAVSSDLWARDTLFLVENQIPFFVLGGLYELVTGGTSSVVDFIAEPVQDLLQKMLFISKKPRPAPPSCSHLLHLVHTYFQPTVLPAENNKMRRHHRPTGRWRRATEYRRYANVRFKPRDFEDNVESSVLDVQLRRGTLSIPRLHVDSNTLTMLRNLVAFEEQQHRKPVTAYCLFLSQVACTAEDVELLRRAGIIDHYMSNDEQVAQGFADIWKGVVMYVDDLDRNYLKPMWHELEERCHSRTQRLIGWFYDKNARTVAVNAILVVCQVTQTCMQLLPDNNRSIQQ